MCEGMKVKSQEKHVDSSKTFRIFPVWVWMSHLLLAHANAHLPASAGLRPAEHLHVAIRGGADGVSLLC